MSTVPLGPAELLAAGDAGHLAALAAHTVQVGSRPEVDLSSLAGSGEELFASELAGYWQACTALWRGGPPTRDTAGVAQNRHLVSRHLQVTAKTGRTYLTEPYRALVAMPSVDRIVEQATSEAPDVAALAGMLEDFDGHADAVDPSTIAVTLFLPAGVTCPGELGGPAWPGEVRRELSVECRRAAWRDRRARRVVRVEAWSNELWPDPRPYRRSATGAQ